MKVIVGLGNPGRAYDDTPHNIGFDIVNEMASDAGVKWKKSWRFPMESASLNIGGGEVLLVKPQTFMNRSGDAVGPLVRKKGVTPAEVLILVDDVELPLGALRLRPKGSAGTHNGLKSMIERLGTNEFPRLRIGLGPVPTGANRVDFVLSKYPGAVREEVRNTVKRSVQAAISWVEFGTEQTMNKFNG